MAAGKLYISGQLLDWTASTASAVELSFVCSGFCLERKFFITTRHFRTSGPAALEKMFCAEDAKDIARISTNRYSPDLTGMLSMLLSQSSRNANECLSDVYDRRKEVTICLPCV